MQKKPCKCWLATGRTTELSEEQKSLLASSIVYDYCTALEDGDHIHAAIRFEKEATFIIIQTIFKGWNIQAIPEHRWTNAVDYVRKGGEYEWKREKLPVQYAEKNPEWKPWQQRILDFPADDRRIMVIIDHQGGKGKSFLANWNACRNRACHIPNMSTYKDLMRSVIDRPSKWYIVDMPRAITDKHAEQIYAAIETIKDGHAWDDRYKFRERWFDSPKITVFTNTEPPYALLTPDRWVTEFI